MATEQRERERGGGARSRRSGHETDEVAKEQTKWLRKRRADRWLTRVIFLRVLSIPTQLPKERSFSEPTPLSQRLMLTVPSSAARQPLQHLALLTGGLEPVSRAVHAGSIVSSEGPELKGRGGKSGSCCYVYLLIHLHIGERSVHVQCCLTSTETVTTIRDGEPWTAPSTFTQLLSAES